MLIYYYPCLCLNLGFFLLMTYKRPFRLTILHSGDRFFTDALIFILPFFSIYI
jgi:hypothetical protein